MVLKRENPWTTEEKLCALRSLDLPSCLYPITALD
jgi:hypothetical protein